MTRRAVLLDRDDTLNADPGYINDPDLLHLLPGTLRGLAILKSAGFQFFVATNQSGVGRGIISPAQLERVHERLRSLLGEGGITIEKIYVCPHVEEDHCRCRKPRPGLVEAFLKENAYTPASCFVIGDKLRDIAAAESAGIRGILLEKPGADKPGEHPKNLVYCARDLVDAAEYILSLEK